MDNCEYWKSGFFHICIIDANIEELCKKIFETGENNEVEFGKLLQTKAIKWLCKVPFGNIIQIITYEDMAR
jgi:hypothetical protein